MLTVGDLLPAFRLRAAVSLQEGKEFAEISDASYPDKWLVLFFWPLDFTFVCPTEIAELANQNEEFVKRGAVVLGASIDSEYVHLAWRKSDERLTDIPFPMLSDLKRELSTALGIVHREAGATLRATFIVDPDKRIRFASAHDLSTGRSVPEIIRTLDALQCGELCPVNWEKGDKTLNAR